MACLILGPRGAGQLGADHYKSDGGGGGENTQKIMQGQVPKKSIE